MHYRHSAAFQSVAADAATGHTRVALQAIVLQRPIREGPSPQNSQSQFLGSIQNLQHLGPG